MIGRQLVQFHRRALRQLGRHGLDPSYGVEGSPNVDVTAPIAAQAETPERIKSSERVATPVSSVKDVSRGRSTSRARPGPVHVPCSSRSRYRNRSSAQVSGDSFACACLQNPRVWPRALCPPPELDRCCASKVIFIIYFLSL